MDQNRCLLDVIDNPQLLQSFLESEPGDSRSQGNLQRAPGTNNNNPLHDVNNIQTPINNPPQDVQESVTNQINNSDTGILPREHYESEPELKPEQHHPLAEISPQLNEEIALPTQTPLELPQTNHLHNQTDVSLSHTHISPIQTDIPNQADLTPDPIQDSLIQPDFLNDQDVGQNEQQLSELPQPSTLGQSDASPINSRTSPPQQTNPSEQPDFNLSQQMEAEPQQAPQVQTEQIPCENLPEQSIEPTQPTQLDATTSVDSQDEQQPQTQGDNPQELPKVQTTIQDNPIAATDKSSTTPTTVSTMTTSTTPTTPAKATVPKKSAPRTSKAKGAKNKEKANQPTTSSNPSQQKPNQPGPYMTTPVQQQRIVFQPANGGIRQPAMMNSASMGQTMGGMPQQQRVIQIQTANGPMYFAIAPGPVMNNPMMNQQQPLHQQRPMMQSQQPNYPSQQLCFQPDSSVMVNRPPLAPGVMQQQQQQPNQNQQQTRIQGPQQAQTQQQMVGPQGGNILVNGQQMIQSPHTHQQRLDAPMMVGQTLAIPNSQNSQPPSSQPIMMPRMPSQIILNRPLNSAGPLLPGQQQFIQILTPNGPMLLALPTQPTQQPMSQSNNGSTIIQNNNNPTMIDYNNQAQVQQSTTSIPSQQSQQQPMQTNEASKSIQSPATKSPNPNNPKNASNSKSGIDLADLLLDCGILPEDRGSSMQSPGSIKTAQSPSIQSISSPMPPTNSPMPHPIDPTSLPPNSNTSQPMTTYPGQPIQQQQPIRITFGPDGQMIMQPHVYGAIRPIMTTQMGQPHLHSVAPNNMIPTNPQIMALNSNPSTPNSSDSNSDNNVKKTTAKGKGSAVKRSRSKKSDLDKFPQLKTPKIAQQQQQQNQQQLQAVTVVPMTVLVGDQNKVLAGSDVKSNVAQLAGGQQMSLAKIVTPVMQASSVQHTSVQSGVIQANIPTTPLGQNQPQGLTTVQNTQIVSSESGTSINTSAMAVPNVTSSSSSSSTSQISSSGNVTTNLLIHRVNNNNPGTVESNPHISSSMMSALSPSVDTLKIEQNGLKTYDGKQPQAQTFKAIQNNNGQLTTIVIHHTSQAHQQLLHQSSAQQIATQNQLNQAQQLARQIDLRAQSILNQLAADQNAAVNPQTKQSFKSVEDACKRLLRYHVFDTETFSEAQIRKVDEMFEAAVESLIKRQKAVYDKYRRSILKQSMNVIPSSEEVMLEQTFVSDELAYIKKERELFREYEAHLESVDQSRSDMTSRDDAGQDYFSFGNSSPKSNNQNHLDSAAHSRDVDDWLLSDKWGESRYPTVPDSEAATAIESILNEELS